jgi:phage N-6-adenine-methyltransferase
VQGDHHAPVPIEPMGSTEWRTPPDLFAQWDAEFGFNVDAAATPENTLVPGRYYTAKSDGTRREHYRPGDRVFANPPYEARIVARFVETAAVTSREQGVLWVMLLNASCTGTRWFHRWIWDARLHRPREGVELRLLPGRISFLRPDGAPGPAPRYPNMLVVFWPRERP